MIALSVTDKRSYGNSKYQITRRLFLRFRSGRGAGRLVRLSYCKARGETVRIRRVVVGRAAVRADAAKVRRVAGAWRTEPPSGLTRLINVTLFI